MIVKSFFKKCVWFGTICIIAGFLAFGGLLLLLELSLPNINKLKDVHLQEPLRIFTSDHKLIAEFGNIRRIPVTINQIPPLLVDATLATEDQRYFSHPGVDFFGLARAGVVLILTGKKRQGGSTITMQVARNFFLTRRKTYTRKIREILLALKINHEFSKNKILELYFNKNFYGRRAYGVAAAAKTYYGETLDQLTLPQIAMIAGIPKAPSALNPLSNPVAAKNRRNHVLDRMYDLRYITKETYQKSIATPITAKYHDFNVSVQAPYIAEMVRQVMINKFGDTSYDKGFTVYTTINSKLEEEANNAVMEGLLSYDKRHGYRGPEKKLGSPPADITSWINLLTKMPTINHLQPAIVLKVKSNSIVALLKDGSKITIPWGGISWARSQKITPNDHEILGPRPHSASNVLHVGNVIRVIQKPNHSWVLSQIPAAEAALVAMNPHDGAIQALTGGFNYFRSNYNRITQAYLQPGSAFKPFLYSAALNLGNTLATRINDAPIAIPDSGENTLWRPENDTRKFYGPTSLRWALVKSRNLVSIRLLQLIGIPYAINYATRFGFEKDEMPVSLSLALGTAAVTPLQLATGYSVFANGGYYVTPYFIDTVFNYQDKPIFKATPAIAGDPTAEINDHSSFKAAPRVITPQNAYLMTSAMQDVIKYGTGRPVRILGRSDLAGKTGTTNKQMDGWFSGFNSNLVTTAWIGFDRQQSLHEYAVKAALPVWIDFMKDALLGQPEATMPEPTGIVTVRVDKNTGKLASPGDKKAIFEKFRQQYVPTQESETTNKQNPETQADFNQLY